MRPTVIPLPKRPPPAEERSDDELMLLARAGARDAFRLLVERHGGRLMAFFLKSVGDRPFAEELAQEAWLSAWGRRAEYVPEGRFTVWLFTIALNRVRNVSRDRARRPVHRDIESESLVRTALRDLAPDELERLLARERRARVESALLSLPPAMREAVLLRFVEELPYDDVARILGTNESTARSRVFHGLRELRRRLRGER